MKSEILRTVIGRRRFWLISVLSAACISFACSTPPPPPPTKPPIKPIELGPEPSPPIYFEKTIYRIPAGTVYGVSRNLLDRKSREPKELVYNSAHTESEEFNVLVADRLSGLGYNAVDPTDATFTPNSTVKARFRMVGVITHLFIDTGKHYHHPERNYQEVTLEMEVRLYDSAVKDVVYSESFKGAARDTGSTPTALPLAVLEAIDGALADPRFVESVTSSKVRAGSGDDSISIPICGRTDKELPEAIPEIEKAVVTVRQGGASGTGVIVSPEGHVLTAAHIVSEDGGTTVEIAGVVTLEAEVLRTNPRADVSLLKIPGTGHRCVPLRLEEDLETGANVFVVGMPLDDRLAGTVTRGVISGRPTLEGQELIQTDASINPGSSGAPLLSEDGRVIGIISSKIFGIGVEGIGFAVPTTLIQEAIGLEVN